MDYIGKLELYFIGSEYCLKCFCYDVEEVKCCDVIFVLQMYVICCLVNKEIGEIKEQEVFIGELLLMIECGMFIINGVECVIVNQIVCSFGVYFKDEMDKNGWCIYNVSVIFNWGVWLKFEMDKNDLFYVCVDKICKINVYVFMCVMGFLDNDVFDKLCYFEFYKKLIDVVNDEGISLED